MEKRVLDYLFSLNLDEPRNAPEILKAKDMYSYIEVEKAFKRFMLRAIEKNSKLEYTDFDFGKIGIDEGTYIEGRVSEMKQIVTKNYIRLAVKNSLKDAFIFENDNLYQFLINNKEERTNKVLGHKKSH